MNVRALPPDESARETSLSASSRWWLHPWVLGAVLIALVFAAYPAFRRGMGDGGEHQMRLVFQRQRDHIGDAVFQGLHGGNLPVGFGLGARCFVALYVSSNISPR